MNNKKAAKKLNKLVAIARACDKGTLRHVTIPNLLRLVDGDLEHVGEASIEGRAVMFGGKRRQDLRFSRAAGEYTIKEKEQPFLMGADGVKHHYPEPVKNGAYAADALLVYLWSHARAGAGREQTFHMRHNTKENAQLHAKAIIAACGGSVEGVDS